MPAEKLRVIPNAVDVEQFQGLNPPVEESPLPCRHLAPSQPALVARPPQTVISSRWTPHAARSEFAISRDEASDLLLASSHLIRDEIYIVDHLDKILERSSSRFEPEAIAVAQASVAGGFWQRPRCQLKLNNIMR